MFRARVTRSILIAGVLGLVLAATGWSAGLMPQADAQGGDFELSLSSAVILDGLSGDVILSVSPGASEAAALSGSVDYNTAELTATACTTLIGVGDCNIDTPGEVKYTAIDPQGWSVTTDLISITFENTGLPVGESSLTITTTTAVDAGATDLTPDVVPGVVSTVTHGDVNCDNTVTVVDALLIAQFSVGNRTGVSTCPLGDPLTQILEPTIDVNCDNASTIVDALLIAQYSVGNRTATTTCPLADPLTEIYLGA